MGSTPARSTRRFCGALMVLSTTLFLGACGGGGGSDSGAGSLGMAAPATTANTEANVDAGAAPGAGATLGVTPNATADGLTDPDGALYGIDACACSQASSAS